jgi:hypothetical protein
MSNTIKITAKCSDMFNAQLVEKSTSSREIIGEHDGYVPAWFPNPQTKHYGDYVELEIDIETGQILNWKKPTTAQLHETFS